MAKPQRKQNESAPDATAEKQRRIQGEQDARDAQKRRSPTASRRPRARPSPASASSPRRRPRSTWPSPASRPRCS